MRLVEILFFRVVVRTSKYFYQFIIIFRFVIIEWKLSKAFLNYLWSDFQSWKTHLTYKSFSKLIFIISSGLARGGSLRITRNFNVFSSDSEATKHAVPY